jgi:hypothetical protein
MDFAIGALMHDHLGSGIGERNDFLVAVGEAKFYLIHG